MWVRYVLLALCVPLAGCASVSGFPRPAMDPREEDAELAPYLKASALTNYENCVDKVGCRNMIIDARLRAVDLAFHRFQRKLYEQQARVGLGSDVLSIALNSVTAITATKQLAAGAGLLSGGRDAYEKQVASASMPVLFEQMAAKRSAVLLRIRQSERMPVASYSVFQALDDISEYEMAGSIPAAAAELGANIGVEARSTRAKLDALRAESFATALPAAPVAVPGVETTPVSTPSPPEAMAATSVISATLPPSATPQ